MSLVITKINKIFLNHKKEFIKFKKYQKKTLQEEKIFKSQILKIFYTKWFTINGSGKWDRTTDLGLMSPAL